jgi:hypothetical protein
MGRNATFLLQGVFTLAEQRGNGVNTPERLNLEAGKMNAGTQTYVENLLAARPKAGAEEAAGSTIDYSEQVQKAIEGFRAADALLAEWEAKRSPGLRTE